jgi:hypothetical protein
MQKRKAAQYSKFEAKKGSSTDCAYTISTSANDSAF